MLERAVLPKAIGRSPLGRCFCEAPLNAAYCRENFMLYVRCMYTEYNYSSKVHESGRQNSKSSRWPDPRVRLAHKIHIFWLRTTVVIIASRITDKMSSEIANLGSTASSPSNSEDSTPNPEHSELPNGNSNKRQREDGEEGDGGDQEVESDNQESNSDNDNEEPQPEEEEKVVNSSPRKRRRAERETIRRDKTLAELLAMMDEYKPVIPDVVTDYYLSRSGFHTSDARIQRLLALVAQKFVSDIAIDALQYHKIRAQGQQSKDRRGAPKDKRTVLTMEDLAAALGDHGVNVRKPEYFL